VVPPGLPAVGGICGGEGGLLNMEAVKLHREMFAVCGRFARKMTSVSRN
jgi:hypothetical protein